MPRLPSTTPWDTLRIYVGVWRQSPWQLAGALLIGPAFALQNIVSPLYIAAAVGQLASGQAVSPSNLWLAMAAYFGGLGLNMLASRYFEVPLNIYGIQKIYDLCLEQLLRQEYGYFADNFGGSLVTRANRMAKGFELFTYTFFLEMLGILTGVLVALGIMIYYSLPLGLAVAVVWLAAIALVVHLALRRMPIRRQAVAKETQQTGELADIIANAVTVKTFAREAAELAGYHRTNNERTGLYMRSWHAANSNAGLVQVVCGLLILVVLIGGVQGITNGQLSIATFLLFQVYLLRIIDSIQKGALVVRQLEGVFGDAHEMTELLARQPLIQDPAHPEPLRIKQGAIRFDQVTFSYGASGNDAPGLFENFTLDIRPGEKIGLVGPSGGGKTTITKLLLRFADIEAGAITIDGQDIRHLRQDDLHRIISFVLQEPLLFHRSIADNISYGKAHADTAAIEAAARRAHAHDFVAALPHGYDTLVGERGIKLSGGQRQRIAIARAMLKDAPVLVLDEATSALDSQSEQFIQRSLWELMEGRTAIVIAHRLSTIQRLDRIVVLDQGTIVEQGTHTELLALDRLYAKLWSHQSGGFVND